MLFHQTNSCLLKTLNLMSCQRNDDLKHLWMQICYYPKFPNLYFKGTRSQTIIQAFCSFHLHPHKKSSSMIRVKFKFSYIAILFCNVTSLYGCVNWICCWIYKISKISTSPKNAIVRAPSCYSLLRFKFCKQKLSK